MGVVDPASSSEEMRNVLSYQGVVGGGSDFLQTGGGVHDGGKVSAARFLAENVPDVASFPGQILPHIDCVPARHNSRTMHTPSLPGA
jgi:hypothetical protein